MKKYRLKKDLLNIRAGNIFEDDGESLYCHSTASLGHNTPTLFVLKTTIETMPEYFEEIKEGAKETPPGYKLKKELPDMPIGTYVFVDEGFSPELGYYYSVRKSFYSKLIHTIKRKDYNDWIEEVKEEKKKYFREISENKRDEYTYFFNGKYYQEITDVMILGSRLFEEKPFGFVLVEPEKEKPYFVRKFLSELRIAYSNIMTKEEAEKEIAEWEQRLMKKEEKKTEPDWKNFEIIGLLRDCVSCLWGISDFILLQKKFDKWLDDNKERIIKIAGLQEREFINSSPLKRKKWKFRLGIRTDGTLFNADYKFDPHYTNNPESINAIVNVEEVEEKTHEERVKEKCAEIVHDEWMRQNNIYKLSGKEKEIIDAYREAKARGTFRIDFISLKHNRVVCSQDWSH